MPIDYKRYPENWQEIRERILIRAGQRRDNNGNIIHEAKCEMCGKVHNYEIGYWKDDEFILIEKSHHGDIEAEEAEQDGYKIIKIVLTIAHLDHDEENHDVKDERLKAACQRCHLRYDAPEKARRRLAKKENEMLFSLKVQGIKIK